MELNTEALQLKTMVEYRKTCPLVSERAGGELYTKVLEMAQSWGWIDFPAEFTYQVIYKTDLNRKDFEKYQRCIDYSKIDCFVEFRHKKSNHTVRFFFPGWGSSAAVLFYNGMELAPDTINTPRDFSLIPDGVAMFTLAALDRSISALNILWWLKYGQAAQAAGDANHLFH